MKRFLIAVLMVAVAPAYAVMEDGSVEMHEQALTQQASGNRNALVLCAAGPDGDGLTACTERPAWRCSP
jgi:hypothetical protein